MCIKIVNLKIKSFKKNIYQKTITEVIFEYKRTNQVQLKTNNRNIKEEQLWRLQLIGQDILQPGLIPGL
jgi:hypothetical protein